MAGMTVVGAIGAFFRYVLVAPIQWSEEVALGLFVWLVFVGAAAVSRHGMHIPIDILVVLLPPATQYWLRIVVHLIVLVLLGAFIVIGWSFAITAWDSRTIALKLPMFWIDLSAVRAAVRTNGLTSPTLTIA